jgi:predicted HTH domain antitoxin
MSILLLSKFDAAERQLLMAIRLFFEGADPVSIHTLAEAASQILYDIREQFGARSMARDNPFIREDKKKEWLQILFKSRNFFKHADRDQDEVHEFNDEANDFAIFEAIHLYATIKNKRVPETFLFEIWFALKYTHLLLDGTYKDAIDKMARDTPRLSHGDLTIFLRNLTKLRSGTVKIENMSLSMGLKP